MLYVCLCPTGYIEVRRVEVQFIVLDLYYAACVPSHPFEHVLGASVSSLAASSIACYDLRNNFLHRIGIDINYQTGMVEWYGYIVPMCKPLPDGEYDTSIYHYFIRA